MKLWKARPSTQDAVARKPLTGPDRKRAVEESIPVGVEIAGQWAWRILAVVGVLVVFGFLVATLKIIVIPFMISILISALLVPFKEFLIRHHWPRWLSIVLALVGTIAIVAALIFVVVTQIKSGYPDIEKRSVSAYNQFRDFLKTSPLQIDDTQFNDYVQQGVKALQANSSVLVTGALSVGSTAVSVLTGGLLTLFSTLFILIDGRGIWAWIVRLFPRRARRAVDGSGRAGWLTLTTFVKVQIFVAAVDAIGIGLGAWILGLIFGGFPLVIPIAILVFLASFIPVVGAVVSGALAVVVALVYLGPLPAVLMLGVVLLVQQVEGHVLQPLVMGSAVKVHPLAVVFAVAAGGFVAGIPGALFAVPLVAVLNVMVKYVASGEWRANPRPQVRDVVSTNDE